MNNLRYAETTTALSRAPGDYLSRGRAVLLPDPESDGDPGVLGEDVEVRSFEDHESGVFVVVGPVNGGWHVLDADFLGS
jgi:hypothetical protein